MLRAVTKPSVVNKAVTFVRASLKNDRGRWRWDVTAQEGPIHKLPQLPGHKIRKYDSDRAGSLYIAVEGTWSAPGPQFGHLGRDRYRGRYEITEVSKADAYQRRWTIGNSKPNVYPGIAAQQEHKLMNPSIWETIKMMFGL